MNVPTAKDLDTCVGRREGVSGNSVRWVCPWFKPSTARSHVPSWPVFPGRSLRRLGIRLVHSRLGKGISKCQKQQSGRREGASDTFPLVSSSGHPGLPFPLLWAPGDWQVTRRDQEGDPCRRRGGGSRSGLRLSHPLKFAVTYLGDPTGIGSPGRAGPGLPQELTGPRAVGNKCSVLAQCPGFLTPSPLSHTHLTPRSLSSCRPVL